MCVYILGGGGMDDVHVYVQHFRNKIRIFLQCKSFCQCQGNLRYSSLTANEDNVFIEQVHKYITHII